MFGLDRLVTINALRDVVGPPDPIPTPTFKNMRPSSQDSVEVDVTSRLKATMVDEIDALDDVLVNDVEHS